MKRIFIFTVFVLISVSQPALSQDYFTYNALGKRDPFAPLIGVKKTSTTKTGIEAISTISDVKFQGVAVDSKNPKTAVINGEMIKVGETIARVKLIDIKGDDITLSIDGEIYNISLYEKEGGHSGVE